MGPAFLAYGGFSESYTRDVLSALNSFCVCLFLTALAYVPASAIAGISRSRWRLIGPIAYAVIALFIVPALGVSGEYGPAHVATVFGAQLLLLGFFVVCAKTAVPQLRHRAESLQPLDPDGGPLSGLQPTPPRPRAPHA